VTAAVRGTLGTADVIVVLAQSELEAYRRFLPPQPVLLCPNGIDVAQYAENARGQSDAAAPLSIVYVGRLAADREALERMGRASRRRIAGCYSIERLSREFRNLYLDLCAPRQTRELSRF
jgi:glycosyltransferase involved in cell wall biosynthesis